MKLEHRFDGRHACGQVAVFAFCVLEDPHVGWQSEDVVLHDGSLGCYDLDGLRESQRVDWEKSQFVDPSPRLQCADRSEQVREQRPQSFGLGAMCWGGECRVLGIMHRFGQRAGRRVPHSLLQASASPVLERHVSRAATDETARILQACREGMLSD